jgi:hypothetical protein
MIYLQQADGTARLSGDANRRSMGNRAGVLALSPTTAVHTKKTEVTTDPEISKRPEAALEATGGQNHPIR